MDIKGAKELARVLEARNGPIPNPQPAPLQAVGAPPIFQWLGIEPPEGDRSSEED